MCPGAPADLKQSSISELRCGGRWWGRGGVGGTAGPGGKLAVCEQKAAQGPLPLGPAPADRPHLTCSPCTLLPACLCLPTILFYQGLRKAGLPAPTHFSLNYKTSSCSSLRQPSLMMTSILQDWKLQHWDIRVKTKSTFSEEL